MRHDWSEQGWTGGRWIVALVMMAVFWAAVAAVVIALLRSRDHGREAARSASAAEPPTSSAERILHERFARGDIDEDEYVRRRDLLTHRSP
jgi:putative membrane protein